MTVSCRYFLAKALFSVITEIDHTLKQLLFKMTFYYNYFHQIAFFIITIDIMKHNPYTKKMTRLCLLNTLQC